MRSSRAFVPLRDFDLMSNHAKSRATVIALVSLTVGLGVAARPPARHSGVRLAGGSGPSCSATLTVQPPRLRGGCVIDERVTRAPGILTFPCGADGAATADFGSSRFLGNVHANIVDLTLITQFDFTDHCHWQSMQRIQGQLSSGRLSYSYQEAPIPGQQRCAPPCSTSTLVLVQ